MKNILHLIILCLLPATFHSCLQEDIEENMVHFDRAFIPVWYYVEVGNFSKADLALERLVNEWNYFKKKSYLAGTTKKKWEASINQIDSWILDACFAINIKDQTLALNQLDHARYELMEWRWRKGMDYYLDYVWNFETALQIVRDIIPDQYQQLSWQEENQKNYQELYQTWNNLKSQSPDPFLFDFSAEDQLRFMQQQEELDQLLQTFAINAHCLNTCDHEEAVLSLHYGYLTFLKTLGNFQHTETYFAKQ